MPVLENPTQDPRPDEELALRLAAREPDALAPLYARYAPLVFHIALQSLDAPAAEDIVQEVFLALWRRADTYDPRRGPFRPWLLQIAHFRVLNELRSRSRRPQREPGGDDGSLEDLPDTGIAPPEAAWRVFRKEAVQAAVEKLPHAQRQALSLAFFEQLTHDQVAEALRLPLGTVKTRIRSGMRRLRTILAPLGVAVIVLAVLAGAAVRIRYQQIMAQRMDHALAFVTASDITTLHLAAGPGVPARTHGSYRGREGTALAVIALHEMPPVPAGVTYRAWVLLDGTWTPVGSALPDASGNALIVTETRAVARMPQAVEVTREASHAGIAPAGPVIIQWEKKE